MSPKHAETYAIDGKYHDTVEEVIGKLESYTADRIQNKESLGPIPRYLHLTVRPLGSNMIMQREIPVDPSRKQHALPSRWVREELHKILRGTERLFAKTKKLSVEVASEFGDKIISIRIDTAERIQKTLAAPPFEAARGHTEPEPKPVPEEQSDPQPDPASQTVPEPQPQPEPEPAPLEEDHTSAHENNGSANGEIIDFNTMKYWPTDMTHIAVRKTLLAAGITTKTQLLEFLGTTAPSRVDWEVFVKKLARIAKQAGFKFYASSDGTLYWWLTKKMKWVEPFTSNQ